MGWFSRIFGGEKPKARKTGEVVRMVRARYDAAQTTPENAKHWANADALSPDAAQLPAQRRTLRMRARYEVANNSYARGIVLTLANDVIGTGPRLQTLVGDGENLDGKSVNGVLETKFMAWSKAVDLPNKLRTMRMAKAQDGEAFGMFITNEKLPTEVKLDLRLIEADQIATPNLMIPTPGQVDGIIFDADNNPVTYHVLRMHPGALYSTGLLQYDPCPAQYMVHLFRQDRPGQHRGLPDIMPALPLFGQLRRFTLATLDAAEACADYAMAMKTTAPPDGQAAEIEKGATMDFEKNMAVFCPEGWEPFQVKAEHPSSTYSEFKKELLNEIARVLNMPYNIASCDSSRYNFASGQLDHQTYFRSLQVEQQHIETVVLDRIFEAWLAEARTVYEELAGLEEVPHQWFWNSREVGNPVDIANAQNTKLANHSITYAEIYGPRGRDWETELRQRAKEIALVNELELPMSNPNITRAEPQAEEPAPADKGAKESGNAKQQKNAA